MTYSPWAALVDSFYSAPFYRHVAHRWRPVALAYLLFALALFWLPTFLKMHWLMNQGIQHFQTDVLPKIPTLRFQNGEFSTVEPKPYVLDFGSTKVPIQVIIDTTGQTKSLEGSAAFLLVTRSQLFLRQRSGETRIYDLSKSRAKPFILSPERVKKIIRPLKYWALAGLYVSIFILSFLKRLIQAFFIALFGLALASLMKLELDLGALLSLAIVSMTPAMAVETVLGVSDKAIPFTWLIGFGLIVGYFLFALNAASDKTAE